MSSTCQHNGSYTVPAVSQINVLISELTRPENILVKKHEFSDPPHNVLLPQPAVCYLLKGGTSLKVSAGFACYWNKVNRSWCSDICVAHMAPSDRALWDSNGHVLLSLLIVAVSRKILFGGELASNSLLLSMQQNQFCQWQDEYSQSWRQGKNRTHQFSVFRPKAAVIFRDYNGQLRLERQGKAGGGKILLSRLPSVSHKYLWAELGTPHSCHCGLVCLQLFSSQLSYTDTCPSHSKIFRR